MSDAIRPMYVPALRMKAGELMGLSALAPDIANHVLPRLIVPPPAERDDSLQDRLFQSDAVPDVSTALAHHWLGRDALIDTSYLLSEFGSDRVSEWLPTMIGKARRAGVYAIPLVALSDFIGDPQSYVTAVDRKKETQLGLVISSGDLTQAELLNRLLEALALVTIDPARCVMIADFHDADFSQPQLVAGVIEGVLDTLETVAPWQQVVFQGTNYPSVNPADEDSCHFVPRSEWAAWKQAVRLDPRTADYMIFGDYAADCAKIDFGGSGIGAIPHYRYATPEGWLVQRGAKSGTHEAVMRRVCGKIVASGLFAGRSFSAADDFIFRTALGAAGPGNAKIWRGVNTTHHITRVVTDIGAVRGMAFQLRKVVPVQEQIPLFT